MGPEERQLEELEELPELIVRNKSRDIILSKPELNRQGASEMRLLKTTVLFNFHGTVKSYAKNSIYCFNSESLIRQWIIWFVDWKWFEYFVLFIIFLNSLALT